MAEEQIPQAWVGEDVIVYGPRDYPTYGRLGGISEFGLVLRHQDTVFWGESNEWGERQGEERLVSNFYPWHRIKSFRLLEEEEKRTG